MSSYQLTETKTCNSEVEITAGCRLKPAQNSLQPDQLTLKFSQKAGSKNCPFYSRNLEKPRIRKLILQSHVTWWWVYQAPWNNFYVQSRIVYSKTADCFSKFYFANGLKITSIRSRWLFNPLCNFAIIAPSMIACLIV